jgi:LmbE family N-acetylglucosaminyl deacetylase
MAARKHATRKNTLVVVGAHPDDIVCIGGVAVKYAKIGYKVVNLSVTLGETVRKPGPEQEKIRLMRKAEGEEISRILKTEFIHLDVPCNKIIPTMEMKMKLVNALRNLKANIVLYTTPWDVHADHRNLSWTMRDVVYYVGHTGIAADYPPCDLKGAYMYDIEVEYNEIHEPDFVIDISGTSDVKFKSILSKKRAAVFGTMAGKSFMEQQKSWTRFWGMRFGVEYAEPLWQSYGSMPMTDVVKKLRVRTDLPIFGM